MELPEVFQGESLKRLFQGAILGAVASMVVGFGFGGWTLGGTAESQAADGAKSAVASALAPFCVDNFQGATNASANLVVLKDKSAYQQARFVEEGGWATLPGSDNPTNGVARACAAILDSLK